jgi:hypothetical protein
MAEQLPLKQLVTGSNPVGVTKKAASSRDAAFLVLISGQPKRSGDVGISYDDHRRIVVDKYMDGLHNPEMQLRLVSKGIDILFSQIGDGLVIILIN